jgi:hypothetical protein
VVPVPKTVINGRRGPSADHATPSTRKSRHYFLGDCGRSVGIVRLRTESHGVCFVQSAPSSCSITNNLHIPVLTLRYSPQSLLHFLSAVRTWDASATLPHHPSADEYRIYILGHGSLQHKLVVLSVLKQSTGVLSCWTSTSTLQSACSEKTSCEGGCRNEG